jgi:aminoglycoside phosphotransferase (APT) family kinase protein
MSAHWSTLGPSELPAVLTGLPGWAWDDGIELSPIGGGLNNQNWRMRSGGTDYFLKIPGVGTEAFVDRAVAHAATVSAAAAGIAPPTHYFDLDSGVEVTGFLEGYRHLSEYELSSTDAIFDVVRTYRRFHSAPLLPRTRTMFEEIDTAEEELRTLRDIPPWMAEVLAGWRRAEQALRASGSDLAPCHNDPNFTNMMIKPGAPLQLVDYEFAANNDPSYELLGMIGFYPVPEPVRFRLIEEYYGRYTLALDARMRIMTLALLVRFGLWAVGNAARRDSDYDYEKYGSVYFVLGAGLLRDPRWEAWLRAV